MSNAKNRDREKRRNRQQHDRTSSLLFVLADWGRIVRPAGEKKKRKIQIGNRIIYRRQESLSDDDELLFLCWKLMEYASSSEMEKKGEEEEEEDEKERKDGGGE